MRRVLVALLAAWSLLAQAADKPPVIIGLDAEFGHVSSTSAEAIRRGIQIAIDEINQAGGVLQGRPLQLVEKANSSLPARSANNLREFAAMPDLVAVFCGRFSPTVLEGLPLIHQLRLPLLDPWAAAEGIVNNGYSPNYVFRLSMSDSWAVQAMLKHLGQRKLTRVGLLALNTSWGRSTRKALEEYVARNNGMRLTGTQWINWDDQLDSMTAKYQSLRGSGAQAVVLVANAEEAAVFAKALLSLPEHQRLPVVSHWGVTGGKLPELVGADFYKLDFRVVQTYSFIGQTSPLASTVISTYNRRFGGSNARAIASPVGVAHAYDLTHLLAKAINLAGSSNRQAVRDALERLPSHTGLIKKYNLPFTSKRHEALQESDVFLAKYAPVDGALEK